MLLCAEKRGRFIPCRGGGTNTTYYTDYHDVDEDARSISLQGGSWTRESLVGIVYRDLDAPTAFTSSDVASRLIYLS